MTPLGGSHFLHRWRLARRGSAAALVADARVDRHLVHLADVPTQAGDATVADAASPPPSPEGGPLGRRWVMVIDLAKCDGCRECTRASPAMHSIPPGPEWIPRYRI